MKSVLFKTIIFRILSVILVQTYFVPDEYWQSLEIAHLSAFGYGYRTWEFKEEIRCAAYPFLFATFYKLLALFHLDYVAILIIGPRVLQAILSAFADTCYFKMCRSFNFPVRDIWTVLLFDWFAFFCSSRTLINTFEMNLVIFGLYTFPWRTKSSPPANLFVYLVSTICFIRPTAILVWGPLCLLWISQSTRKVSVVKAFIFHGGSAVVALCLLDSFFYGHATLTPWNFFKANILNGVSAFYGSHPFHWYFTQGIPVVLGAFTVPFLLQICHIGRLKFLSKRDINLSAVDNVNNIMMLSIGISLLVYSLVPHKEFRFLLPIQPMMMFMALQGMRFLRGEVQTPIFRIILFAGFVVPVLLFGQFHQRASLEVMKSLSSEAALRPNSTSLLFLMPCHSTPMYSHLHLNVPFRFITCEPPIHGNTFDESEVFYADPKKWLEDYLRDNSRSHIVIFDQLLPVLSNVLENFGFRHNEQFFHTLFPDDRVSSNMYIFRHNSWLLS